MDGSPRNRSPSPTRMLGQASPSPLRRSITLNESEIDSEMKHWEEFKVKGRKVSRRSYHSAVFYGQSLYVYGGYESNLGILSDFLTVELSQSLPNFEWKDAIVKSDLKPGPRCRHTAIVYEGKMYLYGGQSKTITNTDQLITFDFNTQKWENITPIQKDQIPRIDSHQSLLWNKPDGKSSMIVVGGFLGGNNGGYSNAVYEYNLVDNEWSILSKNQEVNNEDNPNPIIPQGRMSLGAAIYKNTLYIFGGIEGNTKLNDLWKFDLREKYWNLIKAAGEIVPEPRNGHTLTCYKDILILFGGILDIAHEKNDIFVFNIPKGKWHSVEKDTKMIFEDNFILQPSPSPKKRNQSPNDSKSPNRRKRTISPTRFMFTKPEIVSMESSEDGSPISANNKVKSSFAGQSMNENGTKSPQKYSKLTLGDTLPRADSPSPESLEGLSPTTKLKMKSQFQSNLEVKHLKSKLLQKMNLLKQFEVSEDKKEEFKMVTPTLEAMKKSIESLGMKPDDKTDATILRTMAALENLKASVEKATDDGRSVKIGFKPMARDGHSATICDDKLFIFAGDRHKISFNDLFALNLRFLDSVDF